MNLFGHISHRVVFGIAFGGGAVVKCSICRSCGMVAPYLDETSLKIFRAEKRKQNAEKQKAADPSSELS
jgi:hypothetical protein